MEGVTVETCGVVEVLNSEAFLTKFAIEGGCGNQAAVLELSYPFDRDGERYAYRTTRKEFVNALIAPFERDYGRISRSSGFCKTLAEAMLGSTIRTAEGYVCVTDTMANLLAWGGYMHFHITPGSPLAEDWVEQFGLGVLDIGVLEALLRKRLAASPKELGEELDSGPQATLGVIQELCGRDYVVQSASGKYALAPKGFVALAETTRLGKGHADESVAGITWSDVERSRSRSGLQ